MDGFYFRMNFTNVSKFDVENKIELYIIVVFYLVISITLEKYFKFIKMFCMLN